MGKESEQAFFLKKTYRWPTGTWKDVQYLIIRKMQIKTRIRYHLTPLTIIKKTTNSKCWWWYGEKVTLVHCLWDYKFVEPLWKTVWRFFQKEKKTIEIPHDPAILLLGAYLKNTKTLIHKDTNIYTLYVHCSIIYKSQTCPSIDDWIEKRWYV